MRKVYVVSEYVEISEEDHYSTNLFVTSCEEFADLFVSHMNKSMSGLKVSFSYESFEVF